MPRAMLLAMSPDDVVDAVQRFQTALETSPELQERLPKARSWYALRNGDDGWLFAPSKWAGYVGMTVARYLDDAPNGLDGRKTEKRLQRWFTPIDTYAEQHGELQGALAEFLGQYGRQPNDVARVSVISATKAPDGPDDLADLIIRVVRGLGPDQQTRIRTALRM